MKRVGDDWSGPEESDGFELTPELEAKIEAGIRSAREGRVVSLEEVDARLRATIAAARVDGHEWVTSCSMRWSTAFIIAGRSRCC